MDFIYFSPYMHIFKDHNEAYSISYFWFSDFDFFPCFRRCDQQSSHEHRDCLPPATLDQAVGPHTSVQPSSFLLSFETNAFIFKWTEKSMNKRITAVFLLLPSTLGKRYVPVICSNYYLFTIPWEHTYWENEMLRTPMATLSLAFLTLWKVSLEHLD